MRKLVAIIAISIAAFGFVAVASQPASAGGGAAVVDMSQAPTYLQLNHLAAKACNKPVTSHAYLNAEAAYTTQASAYNSALPVGELAVPGWYFAVSQVCGTPLG